MAWQMDKKQGIKKKIYAASTRDTPVPCLCWSQAWYVEGGVRKSM